MKNKEEQICNEIIKTLKSLRKQYDVDSIESFIEKFNKVPPMSVGEINCRRRRDYK